eukprot:TRINITY_DN9084_c0_g1_i1.p1 TRINITY_DN9084_c0_g1~~TRINITY_DN9084_c0_g1_i1.p1  ORF type:complete len:422 (-),score=89.00 TRINITY_DN9084_c0_g1_i1:121-1386(-)
MEPRSNSRAFRAKIDHTTYASPTAGSNRIFRNNFGFTSNFDDSQHHIPPTPQSALLKPQKAFDPTPDSSITADKPIFSISKMKSMEEVSRRSSLVEARPLKLELLPLKLQDKEVSVSKNDTCDVVTLNDAILSVAGPTLCDKEEPFDLGNVLVLLEAEQDLAAKVQLFEEEIQNGVNVENHTTFCDQRDAFGDEDPPVNVEIVASYGEDGEEIGQLLESFSVASQKELRAKNLRELSNRATVDALWAKRNLKCYSTIETESVSTNTSKNGTPMASKGRGEFREPVSAFKNTTGLTHTKSLSRALLKARSRDNAEMVLELQNALIRILSNLMALIEESKGLKTTGKDLLVMFVEQTREVLNPGVSAAAAKETLALLEGINRELLMLRGDPVAMSLLVYTQKILNHVQDLCVCMPQAVSSKLI